MIAAIVIAVAPISARRARVAAPPAWVTKAKAQLAKLTVKPAAPMTGYSVTSSANPGLTSTTTAATPETTSSNVTSPRPCSRLARAASSQTGTLNDPYTGKIIHFVRAEDLDRGSDRSRGRAR